MIKDSLYEQLYPLTTVAGQHFVEDFSGNTLDTFRWGKDTDDGTVAMSDSVNGGVILTTGAGLYDSVCIGFLADSTSGGANVPLCFDSQGAVIQFVEQWGTASTGVNTTTNGFHSERRGDNAGNNACAMELGKWNTNYQLRTCNSVGAQTDTDSGISAAGGGSISTNKNFFRVEIQPTFATMSINGVLGSTAGTNLPSGGLAPCFGIQNHSTGGASILHVIYCEAWNTA